MNRFSRIGLSARKGAALSLVGISSIVFAQDAPKSVPQTPVQASGQPARTVTENNSSAWALHFQTTDVAQGDPAFAAKYSGPNSLKSRGEIQETTSFDIYGGKHIWKGGELHFDALAWQGFGLSQTLGVEAFPSGNAYKYGTAAPDYMFARLFVRQVFGLGGEQEEIADGPLTLAGKQDINRITVTVGRFSPTDMFDTNVYANDPHTQFMSWAMVNNLAWDYAADSVGFTPGVSVELNQSKWTYRFGWFVMPSKPNSFTGDDEFLMYPNMGAFGPPLKEWEMNSEVEHRYSVHSHPGTIRLGAWLNEANMYTYDGATKILIAQGPNADLSPAQAYRYKYGFGLNWEQEVANNVGMFSRLGWNDGLEQAWTFTDATWSASLGTSFNGELWNRSGDTIGAAIVVSGASSAEQRFLAAGGLGILDGDGAISYAPEEALETYYDTHIGKNTRLSFDYQLVNNPAFNSDRGPVSIFGLRLHWDF